MADLFYMAMIMDYEKKYNYVLGRAERLKKSCSLPYIKDWVDSVFPELQESEDERIRKFIIHLLDNHVSNHVSRKDIKECIAWLEKQGEQKPKKVSIWKHWKESIAGGSEHEQIFLIKVGSIYSISSCLGCECDYIELSELDNLLLEKQGNKPVIMWHDVSEKPDAMKELLVEWDSEDATWHEVAFYHADTKTFWDGERQVENVTRWCYIDDLIEKQSEQKPQRMVSAEAKEAMYNKPAWSEEDETIKNNISHIIRQYDKISKRENKPCWYIGDCLLWMQNIKDRVQPQPKKE